MSPPTGYALADIAALKAISAEDRADGYTRLVKSSPRTGKPTWYTFISANTEASDDDLIVVPNDNPANGRWLLAGSAQSAIAISDESTQLTDKATSINFIGSGVTASNSNGAVTVTIPGAASYESDDASSILGVIVDDSAKAAGKILRLNADARRLVYADAPLSSGGSSSNFDVNSILTDKISGQILLDDDGNILTYP